MEQDIFIDLEGLWKRVNKLLREKGYTQESLSGACFLSDNRINNLTTRKAPPDACELYKISLKLGVSMEYLITGEESSERKRLKRQVKDLFRSIESLVDTSL